MYKYMKVGLIHFMAYPSTINGNGPISETVKKIALDDYFNAIEITWIKDFNERQAVKKILETSHMKIAYGGQPLLLTTGLNINDVNEEGRQKALDILKKGIDEAYEMNASGFAFLSGKYTNEGFDEAYNALVNSTKEICAYAKDKGEMRIALEVFDYDIDKRSLIGPASLAARYAREIRNDFDNFGLMVDLSHMPLLHESIEESINPVKEFIIHAHIGNCVLKSPDLPAYGDAHPRFGFPNSENDVEAVAKYLRMLKEIGFLNEKNPPIVSFEVKPFLDEDPDIVIANSKRVLNEAWTRV
jgi:sugar phosphate isomerase/epimerase